MALLSDQFEVSWRVRGDYVENTWRTRGGHVFLDFRFLRPRPLCKVLDHWKWSKKNSHKFPDQKVEGFIL